MENARFEMLVIMGNSWNVCTIWVCVCVCVVIIVVVAVAGTRSFFFFVCSSRAILLFNKMDSPVWFGNNGVPNLYACIESSAYYIFYWNNNNEMAINFGRWLKFVITCAEQTRIKIMANKNVSIEKSEREREFSVGERNRMQHCYIVYIYIYWYV